MKIVLISTYELGRQPFGLASPAAWLKETGDHHITCLDLALTALDERVIEQADLVAFYLPMHTATRIAAPLIPRIGRINPDAHLCAYGLYAPVNEDYLRRSGIDTVLGGEYEEGLVSLVNRLAAGDHGPQVEPLISLNRQQFRLPDRASLPDLMRYAALKHSNGKLVPAGYTEATRGCKHLCRHCPVVPVYRGHFRVVQPDVVLADIRQQVQAGARHITFGDPDFFNGPGHALKIIRALHDEFPGLTYDVTIKIEHLLQQRQYLPILRETGCLFVTSAVESTSDHVLEIFDKGHTRDDFIEAAALLDDAGLILHPTFVAFTPWTSLEDYLQLLHTILELDLVANVAPIQYAIRLLIPAGSRLLEMESTQAMIDSFDEEALSYPWSHPDPRMDLLHEAVFNLVDALEGTGESRNTIFHKVWRLAHEAAGAGRQSELILPPSKPIPHMTESWFC